MLGNEIFHYGFIIYMSKDYRDTYSSFIGREISTVERIDGDIRFRADQLKFAMKYKHIYLVRYTLGQEKNPNYASNIELVHIFDKKQYEGKLSVDGVGIVSFTKKGTNVAVPLNGGVENAAQVATMPSVPVLPAEQGSAKAAPKPATTPKQVVVPKAAATTKNSVVKLTMQPADKSILDKLDQIKAEDVMSCFAFPFDVTGLECHAEVSENGGVVA